jgi:hypothetical protein
VQVKFNINKSDNMIIQSISLLDQLDKDLNTFAMRIKEWYSWHFPVRASRDRAMSFAVFVVVGGVVVVAAVEGRPPCCHRVARWLCAGAGPDRQGQLRVCPRGAVHRQPSDAERHEAGGVCGVIASALFLCSAPRSCPSIEFLRRVPRSS